VVGFVLDDVGDEILDDFVSLGAVSIEVLDADFLVAWDLGEDGLAGFVDGALATLPHGLFFAEGFDDFSVDTDCVEDCEVWAIRGWFDGDDADGERFADLICADADAVFFLVAGVFNIVNEVLDFRCENFGFCELATFFAQDGVVVVDEVEKFARGSWHYIFSGVGMPRMVRARVRIWT